MRNFALALTILAISTGIAKSASITGAIELVQEDFATLTGTQIDIYNFVISGTDTVTGFDFTTVNGRSFTGDFLQSAAAGPFSTNPELADVTGAGGFLADTFFVSPIGGPANAQTEDSGSVLGSSFSFVDMPIDLSLGDAIVATFSVAANSAAPMFPSANPLAVVAGATVEIMEAVVGGGVELTPPSGDILLGFMTPDVVDDITASGGTITGASFDGGAEDGFFTIDFTDTTVDVALDRTANFNPLAPGLVINAPFTVTTSDGVSHSFNATASVPEPTTLGLIGLAMVGFAARRRQG